MGYCRDAGKLTSLPPTLALCLLANCGTSIVEYATRDQAQNAVATLSNQNLLGRLVYVREVCIHFASCLSLLIENQQT